MGTLEDLRFWERRPDAWRALSQGDLLFHALCGAVQDGTVDEAWQLVEACQATEAEKQTPEDWATTRALFACARAAGRLGQVKADLGEPSEPTPDRAAWVRDAVAAMRGSPRSVMRSESLTVLLVADHGLSARLTLERLAGEGMGAFYPDPRAMAFVSRDLAFRRSEGNAVACVRRMGLGECDKPADVRWRLDRHDCQPLIALWGDSAGGAFALGLAKLLADE